MNKYITGMVSDPDGDYIYLPDHIAALDAVLEEAIWAMEMVREAQETWSDPVATAHVQRCDAFLASPSVRDYRARQEQP